MDDITFPDRDDGRDFWISPTSHHNDPVNVTVIIPTYQAETTLPRALESVLSQTLREIEIIVADDGSTDSSWHMISNWIRSTPRVRALRNKHNRGKSVAMNRTVPFAQGRWLAILDADDWYHPHRLATLITLAEKWDADLVADNQFLFDAVAKAVVGSAWGASNTAWELTFEDFLRGSDAYDNFNLGMLKPILRTDFVRSRGLSYEESARYGEDFIYLLRFFLLDGKALISDVPHYFYTQPFGAISHQWSHGTRKRYDFRTVCDINEIYLSKNADLFTPLQLSLLKTRGHRLEMLENYFLAKEMLNQRESKKLLRWFIDHPALVGYVVRHLFTRYVMRSAASSTERVVRASQKL